MLGTLLGRSGVGGPSSRASRPLGVERLESRDLPSVTSMLTAGVLTITGDANHDDIRVQLDPNANQIVVRSFVDVVARYNTASVNAILINVGTASHDITRIDPAITIPTQIIGGNGSDTLIGGGGMTTLTGGAGNDKLIAGPGPTMLNGLGGVNHLFQVKPTDGVIAGPFDIVTPALPLLNNAPAPAQVLSPTDVSQLIQRAAAATSFNNAIIAVVDRDGRVLGVRVEAGVAPQITGNIGNLVFAIDGALAEARAPAFFSSNAAPLTSRTVEFLAQSVNTQREVESNPSITDPNSTIAGPGIVGPILVGAHFPPNIANTPAADLFGIELTNRDTSIQGGVLLPSRLNVPLQFVTTPPTAATPLASGQGIVPPDSYGFISGLAPNAQPRGTGTLPGGIPIYKNGQLVGGIGVFFPGKTGFADEENSALSSNFDPKKIDLSEVAEYIAFAAVGGVPTDGFPIGTLGGVAPVPGIVEPFGRIDLAGITLDGFGPGGLAGPENLVDFGRALGLGNPNNGTEEPVDKAGDPFVFGSPVPDGWIVQPHNGVGITAAQVTQLVQQGVAQAEQTRSAIRLPLDSTVQEVFAVSDLAGNIVGLFRMPDSLVDALGVTPAKARNVAYYDNPAQLQPQDEIPGVAVGTAATGTSFRYLAGPRFPEAINGDPPGPFSILNDGGSNPINGLNIGAPLPASAFQSVQGFDAFNINTNFRAPTSPQNQNGVIFFPGDSGVYVGNTLIGGYGASGDGVEQNDVIAQVGVGAFAAPPAERIDQVFVRGVRVPYAKFNRNPGGGVT